MQQPQNLKRSGLRAVCAKPRVILLEIGWRWAFGLGAIAMTLAAVERLLASVPVSNGDIAALHSRDSFLIAKAVLHIWEGSGAHLLEVFTIVAAAISLLWVVASGVGRIVTLDPLLSASERNSVGVFGLSFLRMLWAWMGIALCGGIIVAAADAGIANDAAHPNFALYFVLLAIGLPIALGLWSVLNWYLSLAPIFCLRDGQRAFEAVGSATRAARRQRGKFWSVSAAYATPRLIALVLLIVFAALAAAALSKAAAIVVVVVLSLAYFALADFFYIARMAAYIELSTREEAAEALPAVTPPAAEPAPQSS